MVCSIYVCLHSSNNYYARVERFYKNDQKETMNKKYFALKLNPPRPTFPHDITEAERTIMKQHSEYWRGQMAQGKVIAFGPVLDPKAVYGFGIIAVETDDEVTTFIASDPAKDLGSYESYPMLAVVPGQ